jgi:GT2 family glycosyltransferase
MLSKEASGNSRPAARDSTGAPSLVAISILNWNGWQDTLECLESVRRLDYPNFLTVVVDNGSGDDSVQRLREWANETLPNQATFVEYVRETALSGGDADAEARLDDARSPNRLVLVRNEENLGFTGGNNVAIHYALRRVAPADYVFLLNNDAVVESACLTRLLEARRASGAGIIGATIKDPSMATLSFAVSDDPLFRSRQFFQPFVRPRRASPGVSREFQASTWVCGAGMLIGEEVCHAVLERRTSYFDEKLFLYGDDVEFCSFAREAGHKTVLANGAIIVHKPATSSGGFFNPLSYYYMNRNRIFLAARNLRMPWRGLFHLSNSILCSGRILKNLARGRPRAALAILRGTVDGYRGINGKWRHHDRLASLWRRECRPDPQGSA